MPSSAFLSIFFALVSLSFINLCTLSRFSCVWLCNPTDCSPSGSSVHGILQARILEWVATPSSRGSSQPRDWTQVFRFAGDSFLSEPPEKRKTIGVGSLSSLQGNCPNQELNQAFLHCRWILYQLNYLGSPKIFIWLCWVLVVACGIYSLIRNWTWASCSGSKES